MGRRDPVLLLALAAAGGLRLFGLGHDLPFVYNPDEVNIMARALSIARGLDPEYYLYPSFFFYCLFAVMGGLYVTGRAFGRYGSLAQFQTRFFEDPTDFYLAGRLVGVVAALATILFTYRLVATHFGRTAARAAAVLMAVCYFHVRDAHYLKHDVPSALLVVLALTAIDRALAKRSLSSYLVAGAALGVGFATHYYLIFLAPAFALAHLASRGREGFVRVIQAGAVSALTFFLLSPFVLLHLPTALEHMRANRQVVMDRSLTSGAAIFPSLPLYLEFLVKQGLGYLAMGVVVAGCALLARRGRRELAFWGTFPLLFLGFISYTFFAGRYLNPLLPFLAGAFGLAVAALEKRVGPAAAWAVVGLAALQPLYYAVQVDRLFAGDDTRTLARAWLLEHLPPGATVALQSYSVPLPQTASSFRDSLVANDALGELERRGKYASLLEVAEKEPKAFRLVYFGQGDELDRTYLGYDALASSLGPLFERHVQAVVLREAPTPPPEIVQSLFARVAGEGRLLHRLSPFDSAGDERPYIDNEDWPPSAELAHKGPLIEIWAIDGY